MVSCNISLFGKMQRGRSPSFEISNLACMTHTIKANINQRLASMCKQANKQTDKTKEQSTQESKVNTGFLSRSL